MMAMVIATAARTNTATPMANSLPLMALACHRGPQRPFHHGRRLAAGRHENFNRKAVLLAWRGGSCASDQIQDPMAQELRGDEHQRQCQQERQDR